MNEFDIEEKYNEKIPCVKIQDWRSARESPFFSRESREQAVLLDLYFKGKEIKERRVLSEKIESEKDDFLSNVLRPIKNIFNFTVNLSYLIWMETYVRMFNDKKYFSYCLANILLDKIKEEETVLERVKRELKAREEREKNEQK